MPVAWAPRREMSYSFLSTASSCLSLVERKPVTHEHQLLTEGRAALGSHEAARLVSSISWHQLTPACL